MVAEVTASVTREGSDFFEEIGPEFSKTPGAGGTVGTKKTGILVDPGP